MSNKLYSDEWYEGGWEDGERNGQGTYTSPDGEKYVGGWEDGKRNGQGTYTSPDGDKYVGGWKDGEFHGQGKKRKHYWKDCGWSKTVRNL